MRGTGSERDVPAILRELRSKGDPRNVEGMARFGLRSTNVFGMSMPEIRRMGRRLGRDHDLALGLWATGNYEARILASLVDVPAEVSQEQMEAWVREFDNWGICDGCCFNLFDKTPYAHRKALEWSRREEEFVRRAGFSLMAALAVHDKNAPDAKFIEFLPAILEMADDDRNFVRKAVNWALRQIGKRNRALNVEAVKVARELKGRESATARWVAADALRELTSEAVTARLSKKEA
ncbi:MAG TPA: DNA alkylation repair protein [Conexivisphaerales archaeon]|nr:DNA alkylation repair protein [Conexivisphaerales archaeon]